MEGSWVPAMSMEAIQPKMGGVRECSAEKNARISSDHGTPANDDAAAVLVRIMKSKFHKNRLIFRSPVETLLKVRILSHKPTSKTHYVVATVVRVHANAVRLYYRV